MWNVENKICGATDIALTDQGHQQAMETGKRILEEGIPARVEPRLIEQNFGKWESTAREGKEATIEEALSQIERLSRRQD